ncbi:MAG: TRAP transporter large permease [Deltaproteobacteria bacterium]|nr:TRAP transporter large permease [Deltaproteobacteria bacterium]
MDPGLILFGGFIVLLFLGVPIAIALGSTACLVIWAFDQGILGISPTFYANIARFPLLAIPFFILAGLILERCGISRRLVHLAGLLVGPIPGGLAIVAVLVCVFFGGVSGSGPADAAAMGAVLIPAMTALGYDRAFTAGLIAAAGSTAIIIPPSIALIVYGVITETSVPALFAGGIFPGLIAGLCLIVPAFLVSARRGYGGERWGNLREIGAAFKDAFWGLLAPGVILGGLYGGLFTPTEAALVAVFYGLFVGVLVYRTIAWRDLYQLMLDSAVSSAVVMLIVAFAGLFAWTADAVGSIDRLASALLTITNNSLLMILLVNVLLLVAGMLLDAISIFYVFLPILMPLMAHFNWDPLWFGVVMCFNLAMGQFTPPVAVNLYITTFLADTTLEKVSVAIIPFFLSMLAGLILVILWPRLSIAPAVWFGLYSP